MGLLILAPMLGACATAPTGPTVMVLPGTGTSFEQFNADDGVCRDWAAGRTGTMPGQAATSSGVASAAVGTAVGAAAGAAIGAAAGNPALGAAAGAGGGLLVGSAGGVGSSQHAAEQTQWQYDMTYQQCMYAKGHQLPGVPGMYRGGMTPPPPPPPSSIGSRSYQGGSIPPPPPGPPPSPPPDAPQPR
jgi:hypothetical protein